MAMRGSEGNQGLLLLATLASIQIAQGLRPEQIELLAAFFEVLGDNLALLATPLPDCCSSLSTQEQAKDRQ